MKTGLRLNLFLIAGLVLQTAALGAKDLKARHINGVPEGGSLSGFEGLRTVFTKGALGAPTEQERDLAEALRKDLSSGQSTYEQSRAFLKAHPESPWRYSLMLGLGRDAYLRGRYSTCLELWQRTFEEGEKEKDPELYDRVSEAGVELVRMYSKIGRTEDMGPLLKRLSARHMQGGTARFYETALAAHSMMQTVPGESFKCGPYALYRLEASRQPGLAMPKLIRDAQSPARGFSVADVLALSKRLGQHLEAAKRGPGADFIVPAVIHWKVGHFAAITGKEDGLYVVEDPTFRDVHHMSAAVLEDEASGYFLVPQGKLPEGWTALTDDSETKKVYGRGNVGPNEELPPGCYMASSNCVVCAEGEGDADGNPADPSMQCPTCDDDQFMPRYQFDLFQVATVLKDRPIKYHPPVGPALDLQLTYHSKRGVNPLVPLSDTGFGLNWGSNWSGKVHYHLGSILNFNPGGHVYVVSRGYGSEEVTGSAGPYSLAGLGSNGTEMVSANTALGNVSWGFPEQYVRTFPSGWKEVYGLGANANISTEFGTCSPSPCIAPIYHSYDRDYLLTQLIDPQGNAVTLSYVNGRLDKVTDYNGRSISFQYDGSGRVNRVTDPFGRFATFSYDSSNRLTSITDPIKLTTNFGYPGTGSVDFIQTMTTPYGTTSFSSCAGITCSDPDLNPIPSNGERRVDAIDPEGRRERAEFNQSANPGSDGAPVPTGIGSNPGYFQYRNTYYWNHALMHATGGDYTKAYVYHWLHHTAANGASVQSPLLEGFKRPLENRFYYKFPGQADPIFDTGITVARPSTVVRNILGEDGVWREERTELEYNAYKRVSKHTDPAGRQFIYEYAPGSSTDLVSVKDGAGEQLVGMSNYVNGKPQIKKSAGGFGTDYTYNAQGQVTEIRSPSGLKTTLSYDTQGYLRRFEPPNPGQALEFTYDPAMRIKTVTDPIHGTRTLNYDDGDRLLSVLYPDGTSEGSKYEKLDVVENFDRLNRKTQFKYNGVRQVTSMTDPKSQVTGFNWCGCGALEDLYDPRGNHTHWDHDEGGRVVRKTYDDGKGLTYTYNPGANRVVSRTDAKSQVTQYVYDEAGRLTGVHYNSPTTADLTYHYEPTLGRLDQMVDGTGTHQYSYYPLVLGQLGAGQLSTDDGPLALDTITYTYDSDGRLTSRAINGSAESYEFDAKGILAIVENVLGKFNYITDGLGRPFRADYPNGQSVNYSYLPPSQDGRLASIENLGPGGSVLSKFSYLYDSAGQATRLHKVQGGVDTYFDLSASNAYDANGQLQNAMLKNGGDNSTLNSYSWGYDASGNRSSESVNSVLTKSSANSLNQLSQIQRNQTVLEGEFNRDVVSVSLDSVSLALDPANHFKTTLTLAPGDNFFALHALASDGAEIYSNVKINTSQNFVYDSNGNLISDGTRSYEWDIEDRLTKIIESKPGETTEVTFVYDGMFRRTRAISKRNQTIYSDRKFLWDDDKLAEEDDSFGPRHKRFFAEGVQLEENSTIRKFYYHKDMLGSIRGLVNESGVSEAMYDYDLWGNRTRTEGSLESDFGFAGLMKFEPSNLDFSYTREYSAALGRWISRDPIEESGGLNLYQYVDSNPILYVDPFGLDRTSIDVAVQQCAGDPGCLQQLRDAGLIGGAALAAGAACNNPSFWDWLKGLLDGISFAKGGKQNQRNEYNDMAAEAARTTGQDPCDFLKEAYAKATGIERMKIKKAQKAIGCRGSSQDRQ